MNHEVVLTGTSAEDGGLQLHQIASGTLLASYASAGCVSHGLVASARCGLVAAALGARAAVHVWRWSKDQPIERMVCPERLACLAMSTDGAFIAAGGLNGKLYLWETSEGALLKVFDAHYARVTVIRFLGDSQSLLTAGEDGMFRVWSIPRLFEESSARSAGQSMTISFADHTLPITDVVCSPGTSANARALTVSMDCTARLWDIGAGTCLTTTTLPAALRCAAADPCGVRYFAGATDGHVYLIEPHLSAATAGASDGAPVALAPTPTKAPILSMGITASGTLVAAGLQDGNVHIWEAHSRQLVRSLPAIKGPVSVLAVCPRPWDLVAGMAGSGGSHSGPARAIATLKRAAVDAPAVLQVKLRAKTEDPLAVLGSRGAAQAAGAAAEVFVGEDAETVAPVPDQAVSVASAKRLRALNEELLDIVLNSTGKN